MIAGIVFGFHGCERDVAERALLNQEALKPSDNAYDWLGEGIYFWENDPVRAFEFARDTKKCNDPFVIGAVIDLGNCLDMTCRTGANIISSHWEEHVKELYQRGEIKPNNETPRGENGELILRFLDCTVIKMLHHFNDEIGLLPYDSVRAAFGEGKELYPTAGFHEKNHIQLCIRNSEHCIKAVFLPKGYKL